MPEDASKRVETELIDQPEVKAEMLSTIGTTYMVLANYSAARHFLGEAYDLSLNFTDERPAQRRRLCIEWRTCLALNRRLRCGGVVDSEGVARLQKRGNQSGFRVLVVTGYSE